MYLFAHRLGVSLHEYDDIKEANGHVDAMSFFLVFRIYGS